MMGIVRGRRSRRRIEGLRAAQSFFELNHETGQGRGGVALVFKESVVLSLDFFFVGHKAC
jgi:hypothetical protein